MIPYEYILLFISWFGVSIGIFKEEYAIATLSAFMVSILGIFLIANGIDGTSNWGTEMFGIFNLAIGGYIMVRKGVRLIEQGN